MGSKNSKTNGGGDGGSGGGKVKDEEKLLPTSSLPGSSYKGSTPELPPAYYVEVLLPCTPCAATASVSPGPLSQSLGGQPVTPRQWEKIDFEQVMTKFSTGTGELIQLNVKCQDQETVFFKRLSADQKPKQVVVATVSNPENGSSWPTSIIPTLQGALQEQFDQDLYIIIIKKV